MKLTHFTGNAYDTIALFGDNGSVLSYWMTPEAVEDFYKSVLDGTQPGEWEIDDIDIHFDPAHPDNRPVSEWDGETLHTDCETHELANILRGQMVDEDIIHRIRIELGDPACVVCDLAGKVTAAFLPSPIDGKAECEHCLEQSEFTLLHPAGTWLDRAWQDTRNTSPAVTEAICSLASVRRPATSIWEAPTDDEADAVRQYIKKHYGAGEYSWGSDTIVITE